MSLMSKLSVKVKDAVEHRALQDEIVGAYSERPHSIPEAAVDY